MIFLVEDNESIREACAAYLRLKDFEVKEFAGVSGVLEAIEFKMPQLCILDVMLPDGNGFLLAKRIRESWPSLPFLFLTAREAEGDRITGFELGADDYIVKPFSTREMVLRVQAVLRRAQGAGQTGSLRFEKGGSRLEISEAAHRVVLNDRPVELTGAEWKILLHLARSNRVVVSKERILGECLDYFHDGSERTVITHLRNLRVKLGDIEWIETVRGFGYRFEAEAQA